MEPHNESAARESDRFLNEKRKTSIECSDNRQHRNRSNSIRDFVKNLGSITSLKSNVDHMHSTRLGIIHQCFATFAVLVLSAGAGQPIGYSSVLLPQLYVENSTLQIDLEMGSWIASVHSLASPIGSYTSGYMMEFWGRKRALEITIPFSVLGWLCIGFAPHLSVIFIGRILCGYSVGILSATLQVYLGEFSDPWLRGLLIGSPYVSYSIGILLVLMLGVFNWRYVAFAGIILPVLSGFFLFFMPESPVWLIRQSKFTEAYTALKWFRGNELLAKAELHQIATNKAIDKENLKSDESFCYSISKPSAYKPLIIINVFNILLTLSGTYIIIMYTIDIIRDTTGNEMGGTVLATYTGVSRLIFSIIGCFLILKLRRRTLALLSGIGSSVASLILGIYLFIQREKLKTETDYWVTIVCLLVYIGSNTLGFMSLPSLMAGEMLPEKIRGMCGGYIFTIFNIVVFLTSKAYPFVRLNCGTHGLFLIFGTSSLTATIFLYLVYPETKSKSLYQIENYFKRAKFLWIRNDKNLRDMKVLPVNR